MITFLQDSIDTISKTRFIIYYKSYLYLIIKDIISLDSYEFESTLN